MSNSAATPGVQSGQGQLRRADGSKTLDRGVRVGLVVYGVMHLLIALIAIQLVLGEAGGEKASGSGAFDQLAESGAGRAVLWVMVLGFLMLVVWQGIDAAIGHQDEDGGKRVAKRLVSAGRAVLYAVLGVSAATTAIGAGGGSGGGSGGRCDREAHRKELMPPGRRGSAGVRGTPFKVIG